MNFKNIIIRALLAGLTIVVLKKIITPILPANEIVQEIVNIFLLILVIFIFMSKREAKE